MTRNEMLEEIYKQMNAFKPGRTKQINPAADPHLCRIADRCLQFDVDKRYQDCQDIIDELDELISDGVYHPEILDRRFLAEYMENLYSETDQHRFLGALGRDLADSD